MKPLSGLDGTFLHLETPDTPMHVASLHLFEVPGAAGPDGRSDGFAFFGRIRREMDLTVRAFFAITANEGFLAGNPALARSIRNRFPYLDPLNHLQVELLKRYRAGDSAPRVHRGIHLTINGLAAGLRNSG